MGYILYTPLRNLYSSEQFNAQLHLMYEIALLAKRNGRTMISTNFLVKPANSTGFESIFSTGVTSDFFLPPLGRIFYPLEEFLVEEPLRRFVPMAIRPEEYPDFDTIDVVLTFHCQPDRSPLPLESGLSIEDFNWKGLYRKTGPAGSFAVKRIICAQKCCSDEEQQQIRNARFLGVDLVRGDSVGFSSNWNIWVKSFYSEIRSRVSFQSQFFDTARQFIRNSAHLSKGKFMAVHWRRGDRGGGVYQKNSPKNLAAFLAPMLADRAEVSAVFLATNAGSQRDIDDLRSLLKVPVVLYELSRTETDWRLLQHHATVEQLICVEAAYFVAHGRSLKSSSAFSRFVIQERDLRNMPSSTIIWRDLD